MIKPLTVWLKEIEQELFELETDRDNVGNESVIQFIDSKILHLEEEKKTIEQKLKIKLWQIKEFIYQEG